MNITGKIGNVPVNLHATEASGKVIILQLPSPAAPAAPASQATPARGWLAPAVIAGLAVALMAALLWPREQRVSPSPTLSPTVAPTPAPYSQVERERDEAFREAKKAVEELKAM